MHRPALPKSAFLLQLRSVAYSADVGLRVYGLGTQARPRPKSIAFFQKRSETGLFLEVLEPAKRLESLRLRVFAAVCAAVSGRVKPVQSRVFSPPSPGLRFLSRFLAGAAGAKRRT